MRQNLTGERFGRLLVLADSGERKQRAIVWLCLCDCGSEKKVETRLLKHGHTRSCGCLQKELVRERLTVDHTGKKFGMLTALKIVSQGKFGASNYARWLCRCDCGVEKILRSNSLTQGEVHSCGCIKDNGPKHKYRLDSVRSMSRTRAAKRRALNALSFGVFTPDEITRLYLLQRGKCANCGVSLGDDFHRDHKVALSKGGCNDISNIELLCPSCNNKKHAKDPIKWANENGRLL